MLATGQAGQVYMETEKKEEAEVKDEEHEASGKRIKNLISIPL